MKNVLFTMKSLLLILVLLFVAPVMAEEKEEEEIDIRSTRSYRSISDVELDVPYVPTPQVVVEEMLKLAEVKKGDIVYDLGCGDGRIVVTAAKKYGVKGIGVDLDPDRVEESKANVKENKVEKLVTIRQGNALETDVSEASVVTLYLLPSVNLRLKPILQKQLKPGSRIVSHAFDMGDWEPEKEVTVKHEGAPYMIYLWRIPEPPKEEGKEIKKESKEKKEDKAKPAKPAKAKKKSS
jgi:precorrin-6B methylase 2